MKSSYNSFGLTLSLTNDHSKSLFNLIIILFFIFGFDSGLHAQCYSPPSYCIPTATNNAAYGMGMTNVTLNTTANPTQINNTTTANTVGAAGIYNYYSALTVSAGAGVTVNFSITNNTSYASTFKIFVDYNLDGIFGTTAPELVYTSASGVATSSVNTGTFTVPSTTPAGVYRIRVASDYSTNVPTPCGPMVYSAEVEDYNLLVPSSTADIANKGFTSPTMFVAGSNTIGFSFQNISSTTITTADIGYQFGTNTPVLQSLSGLSIAAGATYTATFSTTLTMPSSGSFLLKTWVTNPNYTGSTTPGNDTICRTAAVAMSGTYTINPLLPASSTNYQSFGSMDTALYTLGISGPVLINVAAGTYNEQVDILPVLGVSAINSITFDGGAGNVATRIIQYNASTNINAHTVRFNGCSYVSFQNMTVKALGVNYGLGMHVYGAATFITFKKCSVITSTSTSTGVRPFQINNSTDATNGYATSGTGAGTHDITVDSNYSTGGYVGAFVATNYTTAATNPIFNFRYNYMENIYYYGFSLYAMSGYNIMGNYVKMSTGNTGSYGIYHYSSSGSNKMFVIGNTWENVGYMGIYLYVANTPTGSIVANNYFKGTFSNAAPIGIAMPYTTGLYVYHNTILMNMPGGTGISTNAVSSYSGNDVRNNIIVLQSSSATGLGLQFETGQLATCDYNTILKSNPSSTDIAKVNGNSYQNNNFIGGGGFNTHSFIDDPLLISATDIRPRAICQKGVALTITVPGYGTISWDINGLTRPTTPQIGASEPAGAYPLDIAAGSFILPVSYPVVAGAQDIKVVFKNTGNTAISFYNASVSLGAVTKTIARSVTMNTCGTDTVLFTGANQLTLSVGTNLIKAYAANPNSGIDSNKVNDTITQTYVTPFSGTYTINASAPVSGSNYQSFTSFSTAISMGGVSGPVTVNVVSGSGPYTEQVKFGIIPGMSAVNTVTINGNGNILQANPDANNCYVLMLNGTDNMNINGLTLKTLNTTYGIGVLFTNHADSNVFQNNTIDFTNILTNSTNAFIAFSAATNSVTTTSATHCGIRNLIKNNILKGNPTGGPYYGITHMGGSTEYTSVIMYNQFINNDMRDPYVYAFYITYANRSIFSGNKISMPTRTSATTFYGFYKQVSYYGDTVEKNQIFDIYKQVSTNTNTMYCMYLSSVATGNSAYPEILRNNIFYGIKGQGVQYGIYTSSSYYLNVYHNTIVLDDPAATTTSATYGWYHNGTSTTHNFGFRNNLIYINRGGTGSKYCIYIPSAFTPTGTFSINNNGFYVASNSLSGYVGYYAANFQTLANWKTANSSAFDQASYYANPNFRLYVSSDFYQPSNDSLNNKGANLLSVVPQDFLGVARTATPDFGAYEFNVPAVDAGITRITAPVNPITLGYQSVYATIKNFGTTPIYASNIGWSVNASTQTPFSWTGYMLNGDSSNSSIGVYNFATNGLYNLKVWSSMPNSVNDSLNFNDTATVSLCTPLAGTLTINPSLPASATNYTSFNALIQILQTCGVGGNITVNVAAGTYNTQVAISSIPGLVSPYKLIFEGGDSSLCKLTASGSAAQPYTIYLSAVKNVVFRNMTIENTGASNATSVQLMNAADSNSFVKCTFRVPIGTTSTINPFVASGSLTSPTTTGNSANYLLIDSCTAIGGYYGVVLVGNTSAPKGTSNIIRNSVLVNSYYYGAYLYYQNAVTFMKNSVINTGVIASNTNAYGLYVSYCDNGNNISKNNISGNLGGYGIYAAYNIATSSTRQVIANNMIQYGTGTNICYGIYEVNNSYLDVAFNTVRLNTGDASYGGGAMVSNNTVPTTYTNVRLVNNIFASPSGALSIYIITPANVGTASYTIDNNVYYSTGTYPFRAGGYVTTSLLTFATSVNMLGTVLPGNNAYSMFFLPTFFSATNLRSISPQLDGAAQALSTVSDDIDGNIRNVSTPDIGIYEFSKPANDAGAVAILVPSQPLVPGLSNIKVQIRNYGTATITSVNVSYNIGVTTKTLTYTGTLASGAYDTVTFTSTSGPGGSSQQYNFTGSLVTIYAWTSLPNTVLDSVSINDSTSINICGGLSGIYTIDPAGSGTSNFITIQAAIDKLTCGGVYGPVTFNIAAGTYTGQYMVPMIAGTSAINTILFKSAANNAASVTITSSTSTVSSNYTLNPVGSQFITFQYLTLSNTNATYSRIVSLNKNTTLGINCSDIEFRNCIFNGQSISSTADQYAIIFAPSGEAPTNLRFINDAFNNGSIGITVSGPNVVNQNAVGLTADSNSFTNQYYAALYLTNRFAIKLRKNNISLSSLYTASFGMYLVSQGQQSEIVGNYILNPAGTYGIYLSQQAYYAAPGNLTIANNVINMQASAATTYGLYIANSSQILNYNNTIYLASSATSYAFYVSGNASFINGSTTYPASNNCKVMNNIFKAMGGYIIYAANADAVNSMNATDYNVYYTTGTNLAYVNGVTITTSNFNNMRNAFYSGSDKFSMMVPITFTSASNFLPSLSDSNSWALNGRGYPQFNVTSDYNWNTRSSQIVTGAPDIGAFEFTPSIIPPKATVNGAPANSTSQIFTSFGDTVAIINWASFGTVPTAFDLRYYSGTNPPGSGTYNVTNNYWKFAATGGSFYYYDIVLKYKPAMLGTIPNESNISLTSRTSPTSSWSPISIYSSTLDTIAKSIGTTFLSAAYDFACTDYTNPLPVELRDFTVSKSGRNANVNWKTASEINSHTFVIERSMNGIEFKNAGEVHAAGNSSTTMNYSFTDVNPLGTKNDGIVYYRLRIVDNDGSFTYSTIKSVKFESGSLTINSGYPNPFHSFLNISFYSENAGKGNYLLYNVAGKLILESSLDAVKGMNDFSISNLNDLKPGMYFLSVNVNGEVQTEKLIKE